jgi:hypothetical protein
MKKCCSQLSSAVDTPLVSPNPRTPGHQPWQAMSVDHDTSSFVETTLCWHCNHLPARNAHAAGSSMPCITGDIRQLSANGHGITHGGCCTLYGDSTNTISKHINIKTVEPTAVHSKDAPQTQKQRDAKHKHKCHTDSFFQTLIRMCIHMYVQASSHWSAFSRQCSLSQPLQQPLRLQQTLKPLHDTPLSITRVPLAIAEITMPVCTPSAAAFAAAA